MKGLTTEDKKLMALINQSVDAVDDVSGLGTSEKLRLAQVPGNPAFTAQFDINVIVKYFSVAGGVYTATTAAAVIAASPTLDTPLGAFIFGQGDFSGGYRKSIGQFPVNAWAYDTPFVYGVQSLPTLEYGEPDATAKGALQRGDLVIPYYASPAAVDYACFVIIRCAQNAYGQLLDSLSSDRFWINNVRYQLTDTSADGLLQYDNEIKLLTNSLFGLFQENSVSPTAYKQPSQFQAGIIDIPIGQGVDKNVVMGTYINAKSVNQKFSIFVRSFDRLKA